MTTNENPTSSGDGAPRKFVTPCALPSAHEREVLTILIEECAEVQQRATKLLRFGRDEVQPGQSLTNANRLGVEIGDLLAMIEVAESLGLVSAIDIELGTITKHKKLKEFLQTTAAAGEQKNAVSPA